MRKPLTPWIAVLTALLMLWGQFAIAAYDCPGTLASQSIHATTCLDNGQSLDTNLCKAHCEQSSHSAQTPSFDAPMAALVALWTLVNPLQIVQRDHLPQAAFQLHHSAAPPLRIQFQVFRI